MRILVVYAHYYKYDRIGFHGSRSNDPTPRVTALGNSIAALYEHFTGPSIEVDYGTSTAHNANAPRHQINVVVCTTRHEHVVDRLTIDRSLFIHHASDTPPLELPYECRRILGENVGRFDFYVYMEDDLRINDPTFFDKIKWFNSEVGNGAVLLPSRYEVSMQYRFRKVYCDGDINRINSPIFWNDKGPERLTSRMFNREVHFRLAKNAHAGCYFLNQTQMETWIKAPHFMDRQATFVGPLESAATLGLMRSFPIYKPALENADIFEIEHQDDRFMRYFSGQPINRVADEDRHNIGVVGEG